QRAVARQGREPDLEGLPPGPGALPALVTRRGKVLRIDPSTVNPQGAAGNGVAGVRLAADGDEVIGALPLTGEGPEAILSTSAKGWKVTACSDIPVKGRGGAGVGFHPFVAGEDMLLSATLSPTGFIRNGRKVRAENRAKSTSKGTPDGVVPTIVQ
ncbi:MAG: topoisomerase IV, partial [Actinobacteria bacterium]|nr:topoisomerase IV [Actinomycetota bacterium]